MGCRGCSKKKSPTIQVFKVRVTVPKPIGTLDAKDITRKLVIYAKELLDGTK